MPEEVLIIGGGFAGLAAAVELASAGCRVRLLEQKPHLGGRARSFVDPATGSVVDNGQHILMGCYHATQRFLKTIGTLDRIHFQPRLKLHFLDPGGRLAVLEAIDLPSPWHVLSGVVRSNAFSSKEKFELLHLGRALRSKHGSPDGGNIERVTVEEWLSRIGQSDGLRRRFWDLLCIAALNEDPRIAAAVLFERVLRLALFTSPADSRIGLPRVGLSDCYTEAAAEYIARRGGQVELSRNVTCLVVSRGVCEGVELRDGERVAAGTVLSAVPWYEITKLLPPDLLREEPFFASMLNLCPAPIVSINLWFDRPITELDFVGLRGTTIQCLFNRSKIIGADSNHVALVLSGAHAHVGRPKDELQSLALGELRELLPAARGAELVHSLVIKERFATFSPRPSTEALRPSATTPVKGLYLAGDWTATGLPATIEGAVQSGHRAAQEILQQR